MLQKLQAGFIKNKDRNAYCINEEYFSYDTLLKRVTAIFNGLQDAKVSKETSIGIITIDALDTYAAIYAIWFYGCNYVPLNPKLPEVRNQNILKQASISLIVSATGAKDTGFAEGISAVILDTQSLTDIARELTIYERADSSLLYILFTSGSTGYPKGVPISYFNIKSFLRGYFSIGFELGEDDRFLQMFDLTFDVSIASYLVPGLVGACIYTVPPKGVKYLSVLKTIRDYEITVAAIVPSILNYIQPYFKEILLSRLKVCILTAEASNYLTVNQWQDCIPNASLYNFYGPTEATIWCTFYKSQKSENEENAYNGMLGIGKPFSTVETVILDPDDSAVNGDEKGELCISSDQLTPGYLNDPEKTGKAFFLRNGKRFYRTGDLCRTGKDGNIIYCGRLDHQVKVQGFRIELSEIDIVAGSVFQSNIVSVSYKDRLNVTSICLFVEGREKEKELLEAQLKQMLPYYMVPGRIVYLDVFPYNSAGKIDRVALSEKAKSYSD